MQVARDGASQPLGALVVLFAFLLGCTPLRDFDFWWHLRTGQLILERGAVPYTDWFTYASADRPWIDLHWGFQVAVALLYEAGGIDAVLLAKAALAAAAVAVAWRASGGLPAWLKAAVWTLAVTALAGRILERPDVATLLALAAWLAILAASAGRLRLLWLLPAIQLVWANVHALSVLGLLVGGLFALDRVARRLAPGRLDDGVATPPWRVAAPVAGLVVLANLATPYGVRGALFPLELYRKIAGQGDFYSRRIAEFLPPSSYVQIYGVDTLYLPAALLLLIAALASFAFVSSRAPLSLFRLGVFGAFTYLAFSAVRNVSLWALVTGVVICWNLRDRVEEARAASEPAPRWLRGARARDLAAAGVLLALTASVVSGFWGRHLGAAWGTEFRLGVAAEGWFPFDAIRFAGRPGLPDRAFLVPFSLASLYELEHGPDAKVFMDARLEVATRATYETWEQACALMAAADPRWTERVRDAGGQLPVVIVDPRFEPRIVAGLLATPGWPLVYADEHAAVFVPAEVAAAQQLPGVDPRGRSWYGLLPRGASR
jgi:hypothetical protein